MYTIKGKENEGKMRNCSKKKKKKKKKVVILCSLLLLIVMCFPIKYRYKDGGTVSYRAILYSYTKYNRLLENDRYYKGNEFLIFPFNYLK